MFDPTLSIRLAISVFRLAQRRIQVIGSTAWPIADGKVFSCAVQRDDLHGWVAEITYSYVALGEYYSGTYKRGFHRKKKAESFRERFPGSTLIPVRYKAEQPQISTLLLGDMELLLAGI
jgi:hypothetical protein